MSVRTLLDISLQSEPDRDNLYSKFVQSQRIASIPSFTLESGETIRSVPVAYSTWGTLSENRDNVLVLCHALTGSSDAVDWWRPLVGPGKALDYSRYFIFCANVLGSPYGSASPVSTNPDTGKQYGPDFPETTARDDVAIHKLILDALGVSSIAAVIGGSMGGMTALEWTLCTPPGYVKNVVPITTSAYHGAWGISWGETQRQAIYSDASFKSGWYTPTPSGQPSQGLGTARMIAMLTYRSHGSFEERFSRRPAAPLPRRPSTVASASLPSPPTSHRGSISSTTSDPESKAPDLRIDFAAQSYLHYQADKFLKRFDANCYIHLTRKMDTHDVTRDRLPPRSAQAYPPSEDDLRQVLSKAPSNALVVSVATDVLFRPEQQQELARCLPEARFVSLDSPDGHDGFLLEFERLNQLIRDYLEERCPWVGRGSIVDDATASAEAVVNSVFGEAEDVVF